MNLLKFEFKIISHGTLSETAISMINILMKPNSNSILSIVMSVMFITPAWAVECKVVVGQTVTQASFETTVENVQKISPSTGLLTLKKPEDFNFKAGEAVKVTLETATGKQFRMLSIANSPTKDRLEIAVRESDSEFKKSFFSLSPGAKVELGAPRGQLKYNANLPAVMIATVANHNLIILNSFRTWLLACSVMSI